MVHNNLARLVGNKVNLLLRFTLEDGLCTLSCRFLDAYHAENCVLLSAKNRVVLFTVHIAAGKYSAETFNREIKTYTTEIVAQLKATGKNLEIALGEDAILCPKCKKGVIKTTVKAYGCSAYKEGCDFVIWKQSFGKDISQKMAEQIINKGSSALVKFTSKEGREYQAKLGLGEDFKLKMIFENKK